MNTYCESHLLCSYKLKNSSLRLVSYFSPGSGASQKARLNLDLYMNYELIEPSEGPRLVAELPLRDKTVGRSFQFIRRRLHENSWLFDRCLGPNCRSLALPYLDHRTVVVIAAPADHRSTQRILSTE
jgi:hypothetical protein